MAQLEKEKLQFIRDDKDGVSSLISFMSVLASHFVQGSFCLC